MVKMPFGQSSTKRNKAPKNIKEMIVKSKDFHIVTCDEFIQKYNGIKVITY